MKTENVTVIFDRKKKENRLGYGKVEFQIYLGRGWTGRVCLTLFGERNLTPWAK